MADSWSLEIRKSGFRSQRNGQKSFIEIAEQESVAARGFGNLRFGFNTVEKSTALENGIDCAVQIAGRVRFYDVAMSAGAFDPRSQLHRLVHGENQNFRLVRKIGLSDLAQHRQSVFTGHTEIEHNQIGLESKNPLDRLVPVFRLACNLGIGTAAQDQPNSLANYVVIIDDQNALRQTSSPMDTENDGGNRVPLATARPDGEPRISADSESSGGELKPESRALYNGTNSGQHRVKTVEAGCGAWLIAAAERNVAVKALHLTGVGAHLGSLKRER